ncbi:alpha/beta hydrolase [Streptomyces sp. NPDC059063]|uniref:alpha/beta hydrolase n=1 Tax=unclassified Streptomyces TaxID=2593676 RepID=UPI0036C6F30A
MTSVLTPSSAPAPGPVTPDNPPRERGHAPADGPVVRPVRRRAAHATRALLISLSLLNAALTVLVVAPLPRIPSLVVVAVAVTSWSLVLVPPALAGLGAAALAARRHPWWAPVAALTAFGALVCGTMPYAAAYRTAARYGQPLGVGAYLDGGVNYAKVPFRGRGLTYARVGGERLRLDLWALPKRPAVRRPAVIWVHGGGWTKGHRSQSPRWNRWFNARGWSVFDIDYRLAPRHTQLDQIGDVRCAVGWVRRHARVYGVDPDRLVLAGSSAGGNLALAAAFTQVRGAAHGGGTQRERRTGPACAVRDSSVAGVVSLYGPTDMRHLIERTVLRGDSAMPRLMGGSAATAPERYRLGSPARLVHRGVPPTLLLHGSADRAVPVAQARDLARRLAAVGADATYVELPWADHCFDVNWGGWGSQLARAAIDGFLDRFTDRSPVRQLPGERA